MHSRNPKKKSVRPFVLLSFEMPKITRRTRRIPSLARKQKRRTFYIARPVGQIMSRILLLQRVSYIPESRFYDVSLIAISLWQSVSISVPA